MPCPTSSIHKTRSTLEGGQGAAEELAQTERMIGMVNAGDAAKHNKDPNASFLCLHLSKPNAKDQ
eukprot:4184511-Pyramimonas_sp.AAC.1